MRYHYRVEMYEIEGKLKTSSACKVYYTCGDQMPCTNAQARAAATMALLVGAPYLSVNRSQCHSRTPSPSPISYLPAILLILLQRGDAIPREILDCILWWHEDHCCSSGR